MFLTILIAAGISAAAFVAWKWCDKPKNRDRLQAEWDEVKAKAADVKDDIKDALTKDDK